MADLRREPSRIDTMHERQKLRNDKSKYWTAVIGQNMSLAVCFMIPVFLITLIWTETTLPNLGASLAMDTLLTAALFVFAEQSAINVGVPSGRLDDTYLAIEAAFQARKAEIKKKGILKMDVFCEWQIDEELEGAKKAYCRKYKIDWKTYQEKMACKSEQELINDYGKVKGKMIWKINSLDPIELTPELILGESRRGLRGGISIAGEEYVEKEKYSGSKIAKTILTIVFTVGIGFTFSPGITWGKVAFTIYRLIAVFIRMKVGFDRGAKAFHTVEVKHRESQIWYIDMYDEFLETKGLYEAAEQKYGGANLINLDSKEDQKNETEDQHVKSSGNEMDPQKQRYDRGADAATPNVA